MNCFTKEELELVLNSPDLPEYIKDAKQLSKELGIEPIQLAAALLGQKKMNNANKEKIYFKRNPNAQRFFINIGSLEEIDAKSLMEIIIGQIEEIAKDDFSDVYVKDKYSFFELPKEKINLVLEKLNGMKIHDRNVRVELSEKRERK